MQCLWTRYDSYQQAYDLVTQNRHEITFRGASFGACEAITVRGMRSWDLTTEEVYDGARPYCFGEGSRPNCGTATCNAIKLNECISLYASGRADLIEKAEQICPPREQLGM